MSSIPKNKSMYSNGVSMITKRYFLIIAFLTSFSSSLFCESEWYKQPKVWLTIGTIAATVIMPLYQINKQNQEYKELHLLGSKLTNDVDQQTNYNSASLLTLRANKESTLQHFQDKRDAAICDQERQYWNELRRTVAEELKLFNKQIYASTVSNQREADRRNRTQLEREIQELEDYSKRPHLSEGQKARILEKIQEKQKELDAALLAL